MSGPAGKVLFTMSSRWLFTSLIIVAFPVALSQVLPLIELVAAARIAFFSPGTDFYRAL